MGVISKYISSAHIPIYISQTHQCTLKPDTWEGGLKPVKSCFPSLSRECVRVVTNKYVLDQRKVFSHSRMIIISFHFLLQSSETVEITKELEDLPGLTVDAVWGQAELVLLKEDDIENMPQGTEIRDSCNG